MAAYIWAIDGNGGAASWVAWIKTAAMSAPLGALATVSVYSVLDMVNKVLAAAGPDKISRLVLYGHAKSGVQAVGSGHIINFNNMPVDALGISPVDGKLWNGAEQELARLVPILAPGSRVSLGGCLVGAPPNGEALLKRMSVVLGVTVEAGLWNQRPAFPGYEGPIVRCTGNSCITMTGPFKEFRQ